MELLLISGLLCDDSLWSEQVKVLSGLANITIADHKSHTEIKALAKDILAKAPPKFALAGLSMGGYIALEIMRQAPDRILKLALLDTSPYADSEEKIANRKQQMASAREAGKVSINILFESLIYHTRYSDKALTNALFSMDNNNTVESFINQQKTIISRLDSVPLLSTITCPTLVLCGRQDSLTPLHIHEEMAKSIPEAMLVVIEKCGHISSMERPEEVNAAMLEWLKS